jgi:hypothetical protein
VRWNFLNSIRRAINAPVASVSRIGGFATTHFLMKRLNNVATEMALNVPCYNLTRVINIVGVKPLLAAMRT